jgi:hypothetical protein
MSILAVAESSVERPRGITFIAVIFVAASAYLFVLAVVKLAFPDSISLSLGAPLLQGLELAGPYAFLLAATAAALVAVGLLRQSSLARRAAFVICAVGMFMLIPKVSAAAVDISPQFLWVGSMFVVRMIIVWYLWQQRGAEN